MSETELKIRDELKKVIIETDFSFLQKRDLRFYVDAYMRAIRGEPDFLEIKVCHDE
jgi:hypothetical protein